MNRSIAVIIFALSLQFVHPQARHRLIVDGEYGYLGFSPRITHSGIYAVASFDVDSEAVYLKDFDTPMMTMIKNGTMTRIRADMQLPHDLSAGSTREERGKILQKRRVAGYDGSTVFKKSYYGGSRQLFIDEGGISTSPTNDRISVTVPNRRDLKVAVELKNFRKDISLRFPNDLAFADLIGIDLKGNIFLLVERYRSEIPLNIQRYVYSIAPDGTILSILAVPLIKYCTTVKEFQISAGGSLYHMMTTKERVQVMQWDGLTSFSADTITYPEEFLFSEHYNSHLTNNEAEGEQSFAPAAAGDRQYALRLGEEYVCHTYDCSGVNLAPVNVTASDGDIVRTPSWLITGTNARVAYKWGGFSTVAQYDAGLKSGKYAGDIHTDGVSSTAVGVDCSGFVSRCWGLTYHSSTSNMPSITTQYATWDDLKPGDAVHKVGHVRLFVEKMPNGSLRIVEASGRDWATTYWSYAPSDLNGVYTPRYYNGMANNFSLQRPELLSAAIHTDSTVLLTWTCDTSNVLGYRVYSSPDGKLWSLVLNETMAADSFVVMVLQNAHRSYRVSSILRGAIATESEWSNALSVGNYPNTSRQLIVDGFQKSTGSWRGSGHSFIVRYGNALARRKSSFESVRHSRISAARFSLSNYFSVYWMFGDESTDSETFGASDQSSVKHYLENGGKLFVSGSEIGWDLVEKGNVEDKSFYAAYLKASYKSDDAGGTSVKGLNFLPFTKCEFAIGQTYDEDYPDEIDTAGGSILCFRYNNLKGAGVHYSGEFGSSSMIGNVIYLSFPLESTASDSGFMAAMDAAMEYFDPLSSVDRTLTAPPEKFALMQNYPNPFNPVTTIRFTVGASVRTFLTVYDVVGRTVAILVSGSPLSGDHSVQFDASHLPSGVYFYRLVSDNSITAKKMLLLR